MTQVGRYTQLALTGRLDQVDAVLYHWQDIIFDAALSGALGGIAYRVMDIATGIAQALDDAY